MNSPVGPFVGAYIRARRQALGIGLRDAARRAGMSPTFLSRFEAQPDFSAPAEPKLNALADALRLSRDDVMRRCGRVPADVVAILIAHAGAFAAVRAIGNGQRTIEPCKACGYDKPHGMPCPGKPS